MTLEPVYAALFAKLGTLSATFNTISRRLAFVEELAPELFPAVYQLQTDIGTKALTMHGPIVWTIDAHWYVYAHQPITTLPSTTVLNPLIELAVSLLGTSDGSPGTITVAGDTMGLMLNGQIQIFEGLLGDRAVAVIPVRVIGG